MVHKRECDETHRLCHRLHCRLIFGGHDFLQRQIFLRHYNGDFPNIAYLLSSSPALVRLATTARPDLLAVLPSTKQNAGADLVLWAEVQSSPRIHVTTMRNGRSYAISKTKADEQNENRILRRCERTYSSTKKLDRAKRKLPNHGVTIFPMTCQFLHTRKELFPGFHVL